MTKRAKTMLVRLAVVLLTALIATTTLAIASIAGEGTNNSEPVGIMTPRELGFYI